MSACDIDLLRPSILPLSQSDNSFRGAAFMAFEEVLSDAYFNLDEDFW